MKYLLFFVTMTLSFFSNAAYTTMTIDAVKEANGVWTAAGVMDTAGFVRTTGAVSVLGSSASVPVAFAADVPAASLLFKSAARLAGPVALASAAYDVYSFVTTDGGVTAVNNDWVVSDSTIPYPGFYWRADSGGNASSPTAPQSSPQRAAELWYLWLEGLTGQQYRPVTCSFVTAGQFTCRTPNHPGNTVRGYTCTSSVATASCKPTPADENFWASMKNPPLPILSSGFNKIPSLAGKPIPISGTGVSFQPFSVWRDSPYFKDGNWYRDRMDISPCPTTSQPTRVCVDVGPQKFEGATDPQTVPSQATGTATGTAPKQQENDFCKKNPMSIACAELGTLKDEKLETTELPVNVSYTSWGASNAQCPAPRVINLWEGKSISMSYQPVCDFVSMLRPLLIALAFVTAAFILGGFGRSGGGE